MRDLRDSAAFRPWLGSIVVRLVRTRLRRRKLLSTLGLVTPEPVELRQYLDLLRRHRWFIIEAMVVVGLLAGVMSALRTPQYRATARVLLRPNDPAEQLNPADSLEIAVGLS